MAMASLLLDRWRFEVPYGTYKRIALFLALLASGYVVVVFFTGTTWSALASGEHYSGTAAAASSSSRSADYSRGDTSTGEYYGAGGAHGASADSTSLHGIATTVDSSAGGTGEKGMQVHNKKDLALCLCVSNS